MNLQEKVQLVINIANGQEPIQNLQLALEDNRSDNFIKLAIDHCVATSARDSGNGVQFRFRITEHEGETFTDWAPEVTRFSATEAAGRLRREHPTAALHVERQYV